MLNIAIRFCAGFIVGTAAFVTISVLDPNTPTSTAYHPLSQAPPYFIRFRMEDLHSPGVAPMFYTDCTSDPATRANWWHGPDSWEYATAGIINVQASSTNCNGASYVKLVLAFEYGIDCGAYTPACFDPFTSPANGIHTTDAPHFHVAKGYIWYDQGPATDPYSYAGLPSDNFRKHVSAHEFGHAMSLAGPGVSHHKDLDGKCVGTDWLMTVYANIPVTNPPTFADPICAL
jgi:hypothetical protein